MAANLIANRLPLGLQPGFDTALDRQNVVTADLIRSTNSAAWSFAGSVQPQHDLVRGALGAWTVAGTPLVIPAGPGNGIKFNGTDQYIRRAISLSGIRPHVMLCVWKEGTPSSTQRVVYAMGSAGVSVGAGMYLASGNGTTATVRGFLRSADGSANFTIIDAHTVVAGRIYAAAYIASATQASIQALVVNGEAYQGSSTPILDTAGTATFVHESVGALYRGSGAALFGDGTVLFAGRFVPYGGFDSTATPEPVLVRALKNWTRDAVETWRIFEAPRIWVPVSAGGGAYSLTAESGSYALTGQSVGLLASRALAAGQGSYALTGQDAALNRGYVVAAEQGSYALTGQDAGLLRGLLLTAGQGSYTLSGQDVTLTYAPAGAYSLAADQGSYSLTGRDAGLLWSHVLAAAQGAYALNGQDATLTYTPASAYTLAAGQGSYTLSGQAASFLRTYRLSAGYGAYTLSGQPATLTYSASLIETLETVRLQSRITQSISEPSRLTQQLSLRSQIRH